jgi:hypothetical protein
MEIFITNILTNLIQALILGGLSALINYAYHKAGDIKIKKFYNFAKLAVQAAEESFGAGTGIDKKKYAVDFLISLKVPVKIADALVEAAVKEFIQVLDNKGLENTNTIK